MMPSLNLNLNLNLNLLISVFIKKIQLKISVFIKKKTQFMKIIDTPGLPLFLDLFPSALIFQTQVQIPV